METYHVSDVEDDYSMDRLQEMVHHGTYLNPLDTKLLNGLMTVTVLITATVCIAKLCKLHLSYHPTVHQYILFYCATLQCLLCAIHWILGQYTQLDFVVIFLKVAQFLIVSHLYVTLAFKAAQKDKLSTRLALPVYCVLLFYFTFVVIHGCAHVQSSWVECLQPYWLLLSSAEFLLVQIFMVIIIYITWHLNEINTIEHCQRVQRRDMWILVFAFEISSLCGLTYDITLRLLGNEDIGCRGIFLHMGRMYSFVFGSFMVIKLLLPLWTMIFVFQPLETNDEDELLPRVSGETHHTSIFGLNFGHRYRPLRHPGLDPIASDPECSSSLTSDLSTPVFAPLRRNTPGFAPIREEIIEQEPIIEQRE